jgi:rhamnogalacturonyl hydrolase YesR/lysophospholipase L1-like esterase
MSRTLLVGTLVLAVAVSCFAQQAAQLVPDTLSWSRRIADSFLLRHPGAVTYDSATPSKSWNYEQGLMLEAFRQMSLHTGDQRYFTFVRQNLEQYIEPDGAIRTYKRTEFNLDQIGPGRAVLALSEATGDSRYRIAADTLRAQLRHHPRTHEGGFWHKQIYPSQMWLDGLFMAEPFYAMYASRYGDREAFDDIVNQFVYAYRHTRDEKTGLLTHAWDESRQQRWADPETGRSHHFWGRSLGWFGMALVDVLDFIPVDHPRRDTLLVMLRELCATMLHYRDPQSCTWYQIVDMGGRDSNYLEASVSTMIAYVYAKGANRGYLDPQYLVEAQRTFDGIIRTFVTVDVQGFVNLHKTVMVGGLGGDPYRDGSYAYYMSEKLRTNDMKGYGPFLLAAIELEKGLQAPRIFLVGDSTMADKPPTGNPERGWGQALPLFFRDAVRIENHARNGRSTKSFLREGRWDTVCARLRPDDYVLIQFGHNDSKRDDSTRFAEAHTDYRTNLLRYVADARARGAQPVLITPVARRRFDTTGTYFDAHGDYPAVVREVGNMAHVPVIDLNKASGELIARLGKSASEDLFLRVPPGVYTPFPKGKGDDTHFRWQGAFAMAGLVVDGITSLHLPLTGQLLSPPPLPPVGLNTLVLLDCAYNNEWKADATGKRTRFHYVWDDTANSGYSQLATIITRTGAVVDTLNVPPTTESLSNAALYIIVDPDTPQETENPRTITPSETGVIERWVRAGGTLLLMGNDKGNAESEHFNELAGCFGIHFNEDSFNRVTGKQYETGTFDRFPAHPLFAGVRRIFIKEYSSLQLQPPAQVLFRAPEQGPVVMAVAAVGKGKVFAVGDPWFYNEYMDARRLPAGYDNAAAAGNLFRWLLATAAAPR